MKLFSKYSNLCDRDNSTSQTNGRRYGQIAVAVSTQTTLICFVTKQHREN